MRIIHPLSFFLHITHSVVKHPIQQVVNQLSGPHTFCEHNNEIATHEVYTNWTMNGISASAAQQNQPHCHVLYDCSIRVCLNCPQLSGDDSGVIDSLGVVVTQKKSANNESLYVCICASLSCSTHAHRHTNRQEHTGICSKLLLSV